MKTTMIASLAGLALAGSASATWTEFYTVKTSVTHAPTGIALDVYKIYARFNGPTDTILNAFNLDALAGASLNGFYHQDLSDYASTLSTTAGAWSPALTGSATLNRPFDSYLTCGGIPNATNGVSADPSWGNPLSWFRPDIPAGQNVGWFAPGGSIMGRVGQPGNTADSVILGQFSVAAGTTFGSVGGYSMTIGYNSGVPGAPVQFASGTLFPVPAPGAIALLGLAGLTGRRRR